MYERNAIVLERYFEKKFGLDKTINLKTIYANYSDMVEELERYQIALIEEEKIILDFDETAQKIQIIQKTQEKLCATNEKLEEERNKLFNALDENPSTIEKKLEKIENLVEKNNEELKELRKEFIEALNIFEEKQKERNTQSKERRIEEKNHLELLEKIKNDFQEIDINELKEIKDFITLEKEAVAQEIYNILIKNGKNERVEFYTQAMQLASDERIKIAEKEAECYLVIYDRLKKLLQEIDNDNIKLAKYQKVLRDMGVKFAFLRVEKEYIVGFLDNERMIAINGPKVHQNMMTEACSNFEQDIVQINNLYELILREIAGKSTKKAYKELYNNTYLHDIEQKERNFEQEVNHINIKMGTVINSNYWRIDGIKNIYNVFQEEVTEKFDKDLSEFKIEKDEPTIEGKIEEQRKEKILAVKIFNDDEEPGDNENDEFDDEFEEDEQDIDEDFEDENEDEEFEFDIDYEDDDFDDYEDDDEEDNYEIDDEELDELEEDDEDDEDDENDYDEDLYEFNYDDDDDENEEEDFYEKYKQHFPNKKEEINKDDEHKGLFNKFFKNKRK